ncbi:type II toxin-antitoxin system Phd/YefM family antitoxin [Limibacterium fermenti]|jgi:antitoxin (DNA-binding transcriptional repressor) of toxin-antitoxin stability system|uniref:type II toxin-antitoxin system Phd/YefM family antitoxin n=1 Tax=Limibacterium fermenti TaxID=3229863 RepID=UPI000E8FB875|nr:hypothetical protein [Porphyromonadaceae bacterium]
MAIIQVTSREFRERLASLFDLADKGEKVVIKRGRKRAYTLTPIEDDDLDFTPEMLEKIDRSVQEAKDGKTYEMKQNETLDDFLKRVEKCIM